ncbi:MAG: hypothetical protein IPM50_12510 [Acidobacteriota bacterium]|nr:MAG: hypothetical protein IPM50_12510 [Acidobacteriota bacterium]
MNKLFTMVIALSAAIFAAACGGDTGNTSNNGANKPAANAKTSANAAKPAEEDRIKSIFAMKGERMPDDKKLAEQKREFVNTIHLYLKRTPENLNFNWEERFKNPLEQKLEEGEHTLFITLASAAGKKLEPGDYVATEDEDAADKAPKDKTLAIITIIRPDGAKRLKGNVKVTSVDPIISYSFNEKPDAPGLTSMAYGAPFKN